MGVYGVGVWGGVCVGCVYGVWGVCVWGMGCMCVYGEGRYKYNYMYQLGLQKKTYSVSIKDIISLYDHVHTHTHSPSTHTLTPPPHTHSPSTHTLPPPHTTHTHTHCLGGICENLQTFTGGVDQTLNTGIVTILNYNSRIPAPISALTFAHEAGHNFGSNVRLCQ